jgi:glycine/D-amino acid oxidase-like deaminating enzyme/nitrite reductase/ring-hydroxylating ferredoxin subunit
MESTERSVSVWEVTRAQRTTAPLHGDAEADVCVIGAGIAGMTTAYLLAKAGRRVIVLEKDAVGAGETGQTTAHLSSAMDDYFHVLEHVHGEQGSRIAFQSHQAAIEQIGAIVAAEGIDCDYERVEGYYFLDPGKSVDFLEKERDAARRAGAAPEIVDRIPGVPFDSGPALRFPNLGQFNALKYLSGLADATERLGGRIHTGTHVTSVEGGERVTVSGEGFSVTAGAAVVCTNPPIHDRFAPHSKQAPYRTYVVAARVPAGSIARGLYWDTLEAYHYVRLAPAEGDPAHEWLIVGGEDHKQAHEDDTHEEHWSALEEWTRERFPTAQSFELRWSGMVMEPFDYMGFIGRDPGGRQNVYITTGDSGHGMTHGTLGGMLNADLVLGRPNEWETLYDPKRKTISKDSVMEFVHENVDVALQMTRHAPVGGDVHSEAEIEPGQGAVIQRGLHKVACYRDEQGGVHEMSAVCTHLGCIVRWNGAESSWDCPCHGSRFAPLGEVLTGPAIGPLKKLDGDKE